MRFIPGNKVFAEWWDTWMSRLHSGKTTTADVRYEPVPESEHWQEAEDSNSPSRTVS